MTTMRMALLTPLTLALVGCGALFNNKTSSVSMRSTPVGAEVLVDGHRRGTTPTSVNLSVKEDHWIIFRLDGHEDMTCLIDRRVGTSWIILDILGGVLPIIVDAATGDWYELVQNVCAVTLPTADPAEISPDPVTPSEPVAPPPPEKIPWLPEAPAGTIYVGDFGLMKYAHVECRLSIEAIPAERRMFFSDIRGLEAKGFKISRQIRCEK